MQSGSGFFRWFVKLPTEYHPVAFWFLNHRLEKEELIRQIREMAWRRKG